MALWSNSLGVCRVDLDTLVFVADCASLEVVIHPRGNEARPVRYSGHHTHDEMWVLEDRATGGGGCRLVWVDGICWVSRHSGYAWADITDEVCEALTECGATWVSQDQAYRLTSANPHIYGMREYRERTRF